MKRSAHDRAFTCQAPGCGRLCYARTVAEARRRRFCSIACAGRGHLGVKLRTVPLYITCAREGCGAVREVRNPYDQRHAKYCSRRCASLVNRNIRQARQPWLKSVAARQRRVLERVRALLRSAGVEAATDVLERAALAIFREGYRRGLSSKHRQIRRLVDEIRAARKGRAA